VLHISQHQGAFTRCLIRIFFVKVINKSFTRNHPHVFY